MKPHIADLIAWQNGFRRAHERLEALRIKEIRGSDIVTDLPSFDLAFKSALYLSAPGTPEKTIGLTKLQRALFGLKP